MQPITIQKIKALKGRKHPFATLTAYDYTSAKLVENAGIPLILVGDSASMVMLGYENTIPITVDEMMIFVKSVSRGTQKSLVIADMPFMSYQSSIEEAVQNAGRFIKEGGVSDEISFFKEFNLFITIILNLGFFWINSGCVYK